MMTNRLRVVRQHRDRGTSLTELLVVMLIMGIVTGATAALTIGFQRTNAQNVSRQDQIDTARTAVEAMSKTIRTAVKPVQINSSCGGCTQDAFVAGGDFSVQFYANLDNQGNLVGPSRVTYAVSPSGATAGQLIESIQVPDSNVTFGTAGYVYCPATAVGATALCKARLKTRPVGFGILTTAGSPIFKYYDVSGARMTPATGGSITPTQLGHVLAIEIVIQAQSRNATTAVPTTYIQRVMLPNAQAVIRQGEDAP
jgi:prepilin-type N-terminal cleavage/methylation domain-containing protein